MGMSKDAMKSLRLKSGTSVSAAAIARRAVEVGQKVMFMGKDGLREIPETPFADPMANHVINGQLNGTQGVYKIITKIWVRDHPTKKRGKFRKGFFTVRGWHLANKLAKKHTTQMVRIG